VFRVTKRECMAPAHVRLKIQRRKAGTLRLGAAELCRIAGWVGGERQARANPCDRLVLDHGASGAPVFDCMGRIVAVVSNLFASTLQFMSRAIRISTARGSPNVASVPAQVLKDFSGLE
jgi:hypothetical protein